MGDKSSIGLLLLISSIISLSVKCYSSSKDDLKSYIVYTGNSRSDETSALLHYRYLLDQVAADSNQEPKPVLQHYTKSFSGFVAELTKKEADKMAGLDGVVSVFVNEIRQPLTTKSWDFIGLTQHAQRQYSKSDVIIGVIDSGLWPESASFEDKGFGPPPTKWKGYCDTSNFTCNNKIIGARYYNLGNLPLSANDVESPRDTEGHGTHTASTAAGNPVDMASMLGLAQGTARGGAPSARIAVYKVCWSYGCADASILAAFDDAIRDGVDILSVSLGSDANINNVHFRDATSVGSFHAMQHGILTVVSAGNSGPSPSSLNSFSPWTIVVAASTLDRKFITKVKLGDSSLYEGVSLNIFDLGEKQYPLIFAGDAPSSGVNGSESRFCSNNTLNGNLVKGKIVLCDGGGGAKEALRVGAVGVLLVFEDMDMDTAYSYPLPTCSLNLKDANNIRKYIQSTRSPTTTIFRTNELNNAMAPVVASFSSRGPSKAAVILKPDLIAPGVDILSSWPATTPISDIPGNNKTSKFNIISGTSMACPHVAGAAAYIKSVHPTWSPAAIRSALMTTANNQMSFGNNGDTEFGYGAGQIDPDKALNPGLIYDANADDYIKFLCSHGYNTTTLQKLTRDHSTCSNALHTSTRDLNYPSFTLKAPHPKQHFNGSFRRIVTNVGPPLSTYKAIVTAPNGLKISVNPSVLSFTSLGEKKAFVLNVDGAMEEAFGSTSLIWDCGNLKVRSPIVIYDARAEKEQVHPSPNEQGQPSKNSHVTVIVIVVGVVAIFCVISIVIYIIYRQRHPMPIQSPIFFFY